ncbi:hypothetical protein ACFQZC_25895 [Streptacidiphilus monticola]
MSTTGLVTCPICTTPQTGRYCEECGYDYDLASPSQRVRPQAPTPQQPERPQSWQPSPESPPYGVQYAQQYVSGQTMGGDFRLEPPRERHPARASSPAAAVPAAAAPVPAAAAAAAPDDLGGGGRRGPRLLRRHDVPLRPGRGRAVLPALLPERRVPMTGRGQLRIGRRSHQRGTVPEIDLSVPRRTRAPRTSTRCCRSSRTAAGWSSTRTPPTARR